MKKLPGSLICFVLWLYVSNQARADTPQPGTPQPGFRVSGVTVSRVDGSPVPFCRLTASLTTGPRSRDTPERALRQSAPGGRRPISSGSARGMERTAISDAQGHFSIELPQSGSWLLRGEAPGYHSQAFEQHDNFSASVVVTEAEPTFEMSFRLAPDATIFGRVFDEVGDPVQAAQVRAEVVDDASADKEEQPQEYPPALTDDLGRYEFTALPAGSYRIKVQGRPWYARGDSVGVSSRSSLRRDSSSALDPSLDVVYPITWFPATTEEKSASILTVHAGEEREASVQLTPVPAAHIHISRPGVPGERGDGLAKGLQPADSVSLVSSGSFTTTASRRGSDWDFGSLTPGTYEVHLQGSAGHGSEVRQIQVRAGGPATVGLENSIPLTHVSVVLDGATGEAPLQIAFFDLKTGNRVSISSSGSVRPGPTLPGGDAAPPGEKEQSLNLPPGNYRVLVGGGQTVYLAGISASRGAETTGGVLAVHGGGNVTLTLHLSAGRAEVSGVATKDAKGVAAAMILLVPATLGEARGMTVIERDESNTDGSFLLSGVAPGKYILVAIEDGWSLRWTDPATLAPYLAHGVPIDVRPSATIRQIIAVQPR